MNNHSGGAMSADVQIKCAVEEGMANIMRAIFGENLKTSFLCDMSMAATMVLPAGMTAEDQANRILSVTAEVPILKPDHESCIYRIADTPFMVKANDWAAGFIFEAWCESNPYNGAKVIVRQVNPGLYERWLIADSMDGEVLYRGRFENLPFRWAKEVVAEKWAHLPHVQLDTETAVMVLFMSRRAPDASPAEV